MSSTPAAAARVAIAPLTGFSRSKVRPLTDSTDFPSMRCLTSLICTRLLAPMLHLARPCANDRIQSNHSLAFRVHKEGIDVDLANLRAGSDQIANAEHYAGRRLNDHFRRSAEPIEQGCTA